MNCLVLLGDFFPTTWKLPSASTNPIIQFISCIFVDLISGLTVGIMFGKDSDNFLDKPQFKTAFMLINLSKPVLVKCSFFSIK